MWKSNARDHQVTVREGLETLREDIAKAIAKARDNRVHARFRGRASQPATPSRSVMLAPCHFEA
jgi:hypothetical protein